VKAVARPKSHTGQQNESSCLSGNFNWDGLVRVRRSELSKYVGAGGPFDADTFLYALEFISTSNNTLGGSVLVRVHFEQSGTVASVDFMVVQ
jgi:hypothetical protein